MIYRTFKYRRIQNTDTRSRKINCTVSAGWIYPSNAISRWFWINFNVEREHKWVLCLGRMEPDLTLTIILVGMWNRHVISFVYILQTIYIVWVVWTLPSTNKPMTAEFPLQRSVTRIFDVFSDLRLNKRLSRQPKCRWFETSLPSFHFDVTVMSVTISNSLYEKQSYWFWYFRHRIDAVKGNLEISQILLVTVSTSKIERPTMLIFGKHLQNYNEKIFQSLSTVHNHIA